MAHIELTQGQFAIVDDADLSLVAGYRWVAKGRSTAGLFYAVARIKADGKWGQLCMHRLILGATAGQMVDHIDRNSLNNVRSNLRFCDSFGNSQNRPGWSKSGVKGVCWDKSSGSFKAYINGGGRRIYLGNFANFDDAVLVRDKAAANLHGEFATASRDERRVSI